MDLQSIGFVILSEDVLASAEFYTNILNFESIVTMDWYASLQQSKFNDVYLDIIKKGHEAAGDYLKTSTTTGAMIALIVPDAQKEFHRLKEHGVSVIMELQDEPWGQRRFQVLAPDNMVIEFIERIAPNIEWLQANT